MSKIPTSLRRRKHAMGPARLEEDLRYIIQSVRKEVATMMGARVCELRSTFLVSLVSLKNVVFIYRL